jgi:hypothetical protein
MSHAKRFGIALALAGAALSFPTSAFAASPIDAKPQVEPEAGLPGLSLLQELPLIGSLLHDLLSGVGVGGIGTGGSPSGAGGQGAAGGLGGLLGG